jgi:hypothetical protein
LHFVRAALPIHPETPVITPLDSLSSLSTQHCHSIECKLLFNRDLFSACHILVPDVSHRLSAIYVDNQFYSFFKVVPNAKKALDVMVRLSKRDDHVAITKTKQGYAVWAYEAEARHAPPRHRAGHTLKPVFGPKACPIVVDEFAYELCQLQVPDVQKPLQGLIYETRPYSIFKRDDDVAKTLEVAAKLTQRGDDILVAVAKDEYIVGVFEPNGRIV